MSFEAGSQPPAHPVRAPHPPVTVIVLNWNGLADTLVCLRHVRALDYPALRIVVVDNGSTDGSAEALAIASDGALLIRNPANLGYTGGNNVAIRAALGDGAEYVWLLNNDATVAPDTLTRLVAVGEANPRLGLISPLVARGSTGQFDFAGGLIDIDRCSYRTTTDAAEGRAWQDDHPDRFMLTGTALLLRRPLIERIGLLDDRFFAYWEDTDYALRSLRAGFRNCLVFDVAARHAPRPMQNGQVQRPPHFHYLMARNEILFWRKHAGWPRAARPIHWAFQRQLQLASHLRNTPAAADSIMAGLWDGLLGRAGRYDPTRRMPAVLRRLAR